MIQQTVFPLSDLSQSKSQAAIIIVTAVVFSTLTYIFRKEIRNLLNGGGKSEDKSDNLQIPNNGSKEE